MKKLYLYELRRILLNKFLIGLLVIIALMCHTTLVGSIVPGVACTAPFSGWSYAAYIADILPFVLIALLFLLSFLSSPKERRVAAITAATPIDPRAYRQIRYAAILTGTALLLLWVIAYSLVFYARTFRYKDFGSFLYPLFVTALPALVFTLGLGAFTGHFGKGGLLYGLMPVVLLLSAALPPSLSLTAGTFYRSYPLTLPIGAAGEPAFALPVPMLLGRFGYVVGGLILLLASLRKSRRRPMSVDA